jgi:CDP-diacylglycerol--glycerol-3-phosphate 3-phosphatidyltransferase
MSAVPASLRRQWRLVAVAFAVGTAGGAAAVAAALGGPAGRRWLALVAVPVGYLLVFSRRRLELNRAPAGSDDEDELGDGQQAERVSGATADGGQAYASLGAANGVTLARSGLYAAVAGFVAVVPPAGSGARWGPVALYGVGVGLDWLDGTVARRVGRRTVLGAKLDMAVDTLGFLVAPLVAVAWGRLPVWYLSLSAARYAFKLGCWMRRRRGRPVGDLPPSRVRRPLAGVQMVFITVALLPVVPAAAVRTVAAVVVLPSLLVFARDYAVVAGYTDEDNAQADSLR